MADDKYTLPPCFGTEGTITALLDPSIRREFMALDQGEQGITVEYVWIGGTGQDLRSKTRTITKKIEKAEDLPLWNYDGSSCGQAPGDDSEVYLLPRQIYKDPFRCVLPTPLSPAASLNLSVWYSKEARRASITHENAVCS